MKKEENRKGMMPHTAKKMRFFPLQRRNGREEREGNEKKSVFLPLALSAKGAAIDDTRLPFADVPSPFSSFRIPGPELKDWHMVGHDPVKSAKFSFLKPFCLGELQNDTCQTHAGVAAITYDINPLVQL